MVRYKDFLACLRRWYCRPRLLKVPNNTTGRAGYSTQINWVSHDIYIYTDVFWWIVFMSMDNRTIFLFFLSYFTFIFKFWECIQNILPCDRKHNLPDQTKFLATLLYCSLLVRLNQIIDDLRSFSSRWNFGGCLNANTKILISSDRFQIKILCYSLFSEFMANLPFVEI